MCFKEGTFTLNLIFELGHLKLISTVMVEVEQKYNNFGVRLPWSQMNMCVYTKSIVTGAPSNP